MTTRGEEIEAAVAAYDRAHPLAPLPRSAAGLLSAMFPDSDVYQGSLEAIAAAEGFSRRHLPGTVRHLIKAGLVSWQRGSPPTYRLHVPSLVRR